MNNNIKSIIVLTVTAFLCATILYIVTTITGGA